MSLNKVLLLGRLGKDPELRYTQTQKAVASFSLATSEKTKEGKEVTSWHNVVVWNKAAENVSKYLMKGSKALVEGKLQTRSYEKKDGSKAYVTEVVAHSVQFLDKKEDAPQPNPVVEEPLADLPF